MVVQGRWLVHQWLTRCDGVGAWQGTGAGPFHPGHVGSEVGAAQVCAFHYDHGWTGANWHSGITGGLARCCCTSADYHRISASPVPPTEFLQLRLLKGELEGLLLG
jgi:hypothetical protein